MTPTSSSRRGEIRPAFVIRVRVVSDCAWEGHEGRVERVETGGDEIVHVLIDGESDGRSRQFWPTELKIVSVAGGVD